MAVIVPTVQAPKERSCDQKRRYLRLASAHQALISIFRSGDKDLEVYACRYGPHWHAGHKIRRQESIEGGS